MNLSPYLDWFVFAHVIGVFLFVAGHGVSIAVVYRIRAERDPARMMAYLDLSGWSLGLAFAGLLLLFVAGILAGIVAGEFGQLWLWAAIILFVLISVLMTPFGSTPLTRLRGALGQRTRGMKPSDPPPSPVPMEQVVTMAEALRPGALAAIGGGGFLVILYLMMFKPF